MLMTFHVQSLLSRVSEFAAQTFRSHTQEASITVLQTALLDNIEHLENC